MSCKDGGGVDRTSR